MLRHRGNPGFTWDEAEEGCISKTRFLMVDASCAEQGIRSCEECLGSREGHDRRMHKMVWLLLLKCTVISTKMKLLDIQEWEILEFKDREEGRGQSQWDGNSPPTFQLWLWNELGTMPPQLLFQHSWVHLVALGLSRFLWLISCTCNVGENRYG